MREPPADLDRFRGSFGLSADRQGLVACEDALFVVPLRAVERFDVSRLRPAKGGGGSELTARCRTGYAACPIKDVPVARGANADDLNDVATGLAAAAGRPLELGRYLDDV